MAMDINTAMDMGTNMGMVWNEKIAGDHFYNVI